MSDTEDLSAAAAASGTEADPRVAHRAAHLLPEEEAAGTADRVTQAEIILEESDQRSEDRDAAPDSFVEHRTSDEATAPTD